MKSFEKRVIQFIPHFSGEYFLPIVVHYTMEGKLIEIINAYDNGILYLEGKTAKRKRRK